MLIFSIETFYMYVLMKEISPDLYFAFFVFFHNRRFTSACICDANNAGIFLLKFRNNAVAKITKLTSSSKQKVDSLVLDDQAFNNRLNVRLQFVCYRYLSAADKSTTGPVHVIIKLLLILSVLCRTHTFLRSVLRCTPEFLPFEHRQISTNHYRTYHKQTSHVSHRDKGLYSLPRRRGILRHMFSFLILTLLTQAPEHVVLHF